MDDILDDLVRAARRCERAARAFHQEPLRSVVQRLVDASDSIESAWSGSWIGYQARVYTAGLEPRRPGEIFDREWGALDRLSSRTTGEWAEFDYDTIYEEILKRARGADPDVVKSAADTAARAFEESRGDLLPTFDAVLSSVNDRTLGGLRDKLETLKNHVSRSTFAEAVAPKQIMSRDSLAIHEGRVVPHHLSVKAWLLEQMSYGQQASDVAKIARHAARYLENKHKMTGKTVAKTEGKIFIGHGGSPTWKDLKDFLVDRLGLEYEEYNREPTSGLSTKERLLEMLDAACFAFLVMTAEDEHGDGKMHARANVVHEAGLFQGQYGFERAIIMLEEGCEEFSNVHGIGQIRFPKGDVSANSEEIRRVLEREGIL
ncbi:MAG: TIR domain-containing protein [Planctomycetota bacterium]|jgi:predicted nucleotide-binding protein